MSGIDATQTLADIANAATEVDNLLKVFYWERHALAALRKAQQCIGEARQNVEYAIYRANMKQEAKQ